MPLAPSLHRKLETLAERHEEVGLLLAEPAVLEDTARFRELSREYAKLTPIARQLVDYQRNERELADCHAMLDDPELGALAAADARRLEAVQAVLTEALQWLLIPTDPHDEANLYLELRAGAGGGEAALFAGDLFRMYARYAEAQRWQVEILSEHPGEYGGYKELIARIDGAGAYSRLKFESGVHCVKRVPVTEAQGRVHTSTATVAVLPELNEIDSIEIQPSDLKIDTFRASGAGGQHVNKTDSAIRITHLPSGMVVECQDQRSQHKNRAHALGLLKARLLDQAQSQQTAAQAETRRLQVGSGDRSQRIRTYRYKDNLITDHRIGLESHRLSEVMQGELDELIDGLLREHRAESLQALSAS